MNPWHDIPAGNPSTFTVNAYIETPRGAAAKYELDRSSGLLRLRASGFQDMHYPAALGLIPRTRTASGAPLDIMTYSGADLIHGSYLAARVAGMIEMREKGGNSFVAIAEASESRIDQTGLELTGELLKDLLSFLRKYRSVQQRTVFSEAVLDRRAAMALISESIGNYRSHFSSC